MIKLSLACFVLVFSGLVIADNVPVLIWGPFDHYTPATALKSYDGAEFIDILSEHIAADTFALIVSEDQLSTEDLSQCKTSTGKTCFQGLQQVKSKLYLASVEDPVPVIEDLAGGDKIDVTLLSSGALSEPLNPEGGKYVFINFEDNTSDETKSSKLTRHDQLISKLYHELSEQKLNLIVIYTGKRAEHQKRFVRQAPSTAGQASSTNATAATSPPVASSTTKVTDGVNQPKQQNNATFFQRDQLLIYFTLLNLRATSGDTPVEIDDVTVSGEAGSETLSVTMVSTTGTFGFNVTVRDGYWWAQDYTWNSVPLFSDTRIYALNTFSFHCSPAIQFTSRDRNVHLMWHGLQVQPRLVPEAGNFSAFGDSWDCVGFVSPGILGGLFVVIMLLFILSIGISWMMDINTYDRFDDPKGKTITVNVSE